MGPSNPTLTQRRAPRPCGGVVAGTAISYDKGKQFPWEADTSNDSITAFITVGASPLESTVGNKCLMSRGGEGDGWGGWEGGPPPSVDLDVFGVSKCACWTNCKYSRDIIVAPRRRCSGSVFVRRWQLLGSCYNGELRRDIMARGQRSVFSSVSDLLGSKSSGLQQVSGKTGDSLPGWGAGGA